jgi:hypothetical protein
MQTQELLATLSKRLSDLEDITKIQCSKGNWDASEYMLGLANGLILALATIQGTDVNYLTLPKNPNALEEALSHAFNYHGFDAKLNTPDFILASSVVDEVQKHLDGKTDVQVLRAMTPEERKAAFDACAQAENTAAEADDAEACDTGNNPHGNNAVYDRGHVPAEHGGGDRGRVQESDPSPGSKVRWSPEPTVYVEWKPVLDQASIHVAHILAREAAARVDSHRAMRAFRGLL